MTFSDKQLVIQNICYNEQMKNDFIKNSGLSLATGIMIAIMVTANGILANIILSLTVEKNKKPVTHRK